MQNRFAGLTPGEAINLYCNLYQNKREQQLWFKVLNGRYRDADKLIASKEIQRLVSEKQKLFE